MKKFILHLVIFLSPSVFSQNIEKVKTKNKETGTKEVYYVFKSTPSVRHGNYRQYKHHKLTLNGYYKNGLRDSILTEYTGNGRGIRSEAHYKKNLLNGIYTQYSFDGKSIIQQGRYENNQKNGLWTQYSYDGTKIKSRGEYSKDEKTGVWEFYTTQLYQKYNFTTRELLYYDTTSFTEKDFEAFIVEGTDTLKIKLDRPAMYIGGANALGNDIGNRIHYPTFAIEQEISGKTYIGFAIDTNGTATDFKILRGLQGCPECDLEAIRVLKEISGNWLPALYKEKPFLTRFAVPISYKLQ